MSEEQTTAKVGNQTPGQEEYDALKAELETERQKAQSLVDEATKSLRERVSALETLASQQQAELNAKIEELEGARAAYAYAVGDFKKLAASSNPLVPAEAIFGTTVEEVKAYLERANALVGKVREAIAEQASQATIPAGAPARTGPDTGAMTTREKINYGLEQSKRRKE